MPAKLPFLTAYGERKDCKIPCGSKEEPIWEYKINAKGQKVLEQVGTENIYEKIQSFAEESKLENVLAKCIQGDTSVLRPDGIYGDITNLPKNLIEARQAIQNLENTWAKIPQEIKNKYNNDVELFIGKSGTKEWQEDMGLIPVKLKENPIEKVAETPTISEHGEVE